MRKFAVLTGLYSVSHFIVDFSCAFLIFSKLHGSDIWLTCLFTYNFMAFAFQMPLGLIADKIKRNSVFAALGCILSAAANFMAPSPLALCSVAGLGNALFHIGAGRDVLSGSGKRFSALGIFVSPGAMGLFLGSLCGKSGLLPLYIVLCALSMDAVVIVFFGSKLSGMRDEGFDRSEKKDLMGSSIAFMLLCLFLVVCLRSYVGMTLAFPWKGEGHYAFYLVLAVVFGKAFGGVLADCFGPIKVSFASLFLSAVLFLLYKAPVYGIIAVLLFNMTMPITLGAVARIMPQYLGFGFGLLTFGLFIGLIPKFLTAQCWLILPYGYTAACIVSACLLYYGLRIPRKELSKNAD